MNKHITSIRRVSYTGLILSLVVAMGVILFMVMSDYRFFMSNNGFRYCMIAGCVISVLDMSLVLLAVRKRIPALRQSESLEAKLSGYASLMKGIYLGTSATVLVLGSLIVLSYNSKLIMFLLLIVLTLFFCFPNMYKMKVDLGLDDTQMTMLFGDDYIPDPPMEEDNQ